MKLITTILAILAIAVSVASCKKNEPQRMPEGSDLIIVHVKANATLRSTAGTISIEECMAQAKSMIYTPKGYDHFVVGAINEEDKDYTTNSIKMRAWSIIDNGEFQDRLGTSKDFILVTPQADTVGYIPNRLIHEAFSKAKQHFQEQRYEDVVNVFTTAFIAHPCTGAQYVALKQQGQN